ncbi:MULTISPECIES: 3-oxoacyl-ACP reductase [unclassified Enterococcus]|uniref:3-oxoacyl-ACP reductase n=1 Tax=unclassified Enterococcus TaxID=2608891 RepID=UPI000BBD3DA3|nr:MULTISPECIES: 3-oxoacyl-ACP reductase [unclassified Enterococcus]ATF72320.1 3-oxoacyl-ACP reductase [Enterococcus sp. FDAARGOS_375]
MTAPWIDDKTIVFVTGAASGIGKAQAEAFLAEGAQVFGVDCQSFPDSLLAQPRFFGTCCDLAVKENCLAAVQACVTHFGGITVLLNTAGKLDDYHTIAETTSMEWEEIFQTNVSSMFYLTKEILPLMQANGGGTIINMASIAGMVAGGGGIAYTTAKHAIVGFTKQLALDVADQGISVKGIAPGAIQTPMNAADFAGDGKMAQWVAEETPVKRWAQPEEVAALTLFLASPQASYLQGAIVSIDGGWTLK